jgi:hypothetical protein
VLGDVIGQKCLVVLVRFGPDMEETRGSTFPAFASVAKDLILVYGPTAKIVLGKAFTFIDGFTQPNHVRA